MADVDPDGYGWCTRCGLTYAPQFVGPDARWLPTCECAGDPPVDRDSDAYARWLRAVANFHWQPSRHRVPVPPPLRAVPDPALSGMAPIADIAGDLSDQLTLSTLRTLRRAMTIAYGDQGDERLRDHLNTILHETPEETP